MDNKEVKEPTFKVSGNELFMKIIWSAMAAICAYAAVQLRTLSTNVGELNIKMATVIQAMGTTDKTVQDHETRIRKNEVLIIDHEGRLRVLERSR